MGTLVQGWAATSRKVWEQSTQGSTGVISCFTTEHEKWPRVLRAALTHAMETCDDPWVDTELKYAPAELRLVLKKTVETSGKGEYTDYILKIEPYSLKPIQLYAFQKYIRRLMMILQRLPELEGIRAITGTVEFQSDCGHLIK